MLHPRVWHRWQPLGGCPGGSGVPGGDSGVSGWVLRGAQGSTRYRMHRGGKAQGQAWEGTSVTLWGHLGWPQSPRAGISVPPGTGCSLLCSCHQPSPKNMSWLRVPFPSLRHLQPYASN